MGGRCCRWNEKVDGVPRKDDKEQGYKFTKKGVVMEFYGLPPIGQEQRRPMDETQFIPRGLDLRQCYE